MDKTVKRVCIRLVNWLSGNIAEVAIFISIFLILANTSGLAQNIKQGSIWYVGDGLGFDFKYDPPKILNDCGMYFIRQRTSTITDENGDLLFYTDGDSVRNKFHEVMQNGTGMNIYGGSSPQSSVIVPHPGDGQLYFIFTSDRSDAFSPAAFSYSIIDVSGNGGLGTVLQKNVKLLDWGTALLSVCMHADEKSFWAVIHSFGDNKFYAYRISETGIAAPVVSSTGPVYDYDAWQMKISPDGTKIGIANHGKTDLFDFNSLTGKISNARALGVIGAIGVEFSPNSELLYFSTYQSSLGNASLYQYDVSYADVNEILASEVKVGQKYRQGDFGDIQLAYDGRIYVSLGGGGGADSLIFVAKPDVKGIGCKYSNQGIVPPFNFSAFMPMAVQSYYRESPSVPVVNGCKGEISRLAVTSLGYADSIKWDFGDGEEVSFVMSNGKIVNHLYDHTGVYNISAIKYIGTVARVLNSTLTIHEKPEIELVSDSTLCKGEKILLDAGANRLYEWSTGDKTETLEVSEAGTYSVIIYDQFCSNSDDVQVKVIDYPQFSLGDDLVFCDQTSTELSVTYNSDYTYQWSTGASGNTIQIHNSGEYKISVSNGRCINKDSIVVNFAAINPTSFVDTTLVIPFEKDLKLVQEGLNIQEWKWNFGDGSEEVLHLPYVNHHYEKAGSYKGYVELSNDFGCTKKLPFEVEIPYHLFIPNVFTPNGDDTNESFEIQYNGNVNKFRLVVVDVYGEEVFSSNSIDEKWQGSDVFNGVFYYRMVLNNENYNGWIHVVK
jgi:gliding motility-associated-like protein